MATVAGATRPVGERLRWWREHRRLSQLELAVQVDVSTRHLSFVETGRSKPSSRMILRLTEHLDVPLRERNQLLLAGGYAPVYPEHGLDAAAMEAVRGAVQQVLTGHEPLPAVLVDRHWNLVDANSAIDFLTDGVAPELLEPPANVLRLSLHPRGLAPRIVNHGEWRAHLLGRLRRQAAVTADPVLAELLDELRTYPCEDVQPDVELPGPGQVAVPLQVRVGQRVLSFVSTTAVFGTPLDVTLAELAIESFYPADSETAQVLRLLDVSRTGRS